MTKAKVTFGIFISLVSVGILASEDVVVPLSDVIQSIANLVQNFKGLGGIGIASAVLLIFIQMLKTELLGGFLEQKSPLVKRLLITIFGQIGGILVGLNSGMGILDSVIAGLLTSGGAVAIYEAIKPFFNKN